MAIRARHGVDLTRIDGVDVLVAQTVISEVGLDMSRGKTEAHFASWLGLCQDNRISGDKVLARGTRHVLNRAATALRLGASTLLKNQTYLGRSTDACAASSAPLKPSPPWHVGLPPCPPGLSDAEVWSAVHRQRCRVLRTKKPPTTNRVSQKEGGPTRPTCHTSAYLIKKFLESRTRPSCGYYEALVRERLKTSLSSSSVPSLCGRYRPRSIRPAIRCSDGLA